jgi:hypothetical protein
LNWKVGKWTASPNPPQNRSEFVEWIIQNDPRVQQIISSRWVQIQRAHPDASVTEYQTWANQMWMQWVRHRDKGFEKTKKKQLSVVNPASSPPSVPNAPLPPPPFTPDNGASNLPSSATDMSPLSSSRTFVNGFDKLSLQSPFQSTRKRAYNEFDTSESLPADTNPSPLKKPRTSRMALLNLINCHIDEGLISSEEIIEFVLSKNSDIAQAGMNEIDGDEMADVADDTFQDEEMSDIYGDAGTESFRVSGRGGNAGGDSDEYEEEPSASESDEYDSDSESQYESASESEIPRPNRTPALDISNSAPSPPTCIPSESPPIAPSVHDPPPSRPRVRLFDRLQEELELPESAPLDNNLGVPIDPPTPTTQTLIPCNPIPYTPFPAAALSQLEPQDQDAMAPDREATKRPDDFGIASRPPHSVDPTVAEFHLALDEDEDLEMRDKVERREVNRVVLDWNAEPEEGGRPTPPPADSDSGPQGDGDGDVAPASPPPIDLVPDEFTDQAALEKEVERKEL